MMTMMKKMSITSQVGMRLKLKAVTTTARRVTGAGRMIRVWPSSVENSGGDVGSSRRWCREL